MRWITLLLVSLLVAGCGDGAAPQAGDGLELATVGLLGDLPPAEGAVVVTVRADGALSVDGKPCGWDELAERLDGLTKPRGTEGPGRAPIPATMTAEQVEEDLEEVEEETEEVQEQEIVAEEPVIADAGIADTPAGTMSGKKLDLARLVPRARDAGTFAPDGTRNADVLLRVDRRVPWAVVVRVLVTLSAPRLQLPRVFHAVRAADGGGEGALAVFLPRDRGCGGAPLEGHDVATVRLQAVAGEAPRDAGELADALVARVARPETLLVVELTAPMEAPFGVLLRAVEGALRARAANVLFQGNAVPKEPPATLCKAAETGPYRWRLSGEPQTLRPVRGPEPARRAGGYVGVTNDPQLGDEPEEEAVEPAPEDDK